MFDIARVPAVSLSLAGSAYGLAAGFGDFFSRPGTIEGKTHVKNAQRLCALRLAERRQLNFRLSHPASRSMRFDKALSSALDTMIDHPSIRYAGKFAKPFGHLFKLSGFGQLP